MIDVQAINTQTLWFREGREKGREEGREVGLRASVVTVLSARGIALSAEQRQALDACHDVPTLERWIAQAVSAASAEEALR